MHSEAAECSGVAPKAKSKVRGWLIIWPLWFLFAAIARQSIIETLRLSIAKDQYSYILLAICISLAIIIAERQRIKSLAHADFVAGIPALAVAALVLLFLTASSVGLSSDVQRAVQMSVLVLSCVGGFVLCLGRLAFNCALFPLLLLFGAVPLPDRMLTVIIDQLQQGSALSAAALFWVAGVPVAREGTVLAIPGLTMLVAPECSSIRSTALLFVTTLTLTHFLLRSRWHRVLVVALSVPLSIAKNGLRIFIIAMLGTRLDPAYLTGRLHRYGGIVLFALIVTAVLGLVFMLRARERKRQVFSLPSTRAAGDRPRILV